MLCTNKKRKLLNGQLDSPAPKHNYWNKHSIPKYFTAFQENQKEQGASKHAKDINPKRPSNGYESDPESAEDSNSFAGNVGSAIFSCSDSTHDSQVSTTCSSSALSTRKKSSHDPCSSTTGTEIHVSGQENVCFTHHETRTNEEHNEEHDEDVLYSSDVLIVLDELLLGNQKVSQYASRRGGSQKPTIDQEFEQYFSMLLM